VHDIIVAIVAERLPPPEVTLFELAAVMPVLRVKQWGRVGRH